MYTIINTKKALNKTAASPFITMVAAFLTALVNNAAPVFKTHKIKPNDGLQKINKLFFSGIPKFYFKNKFHRFDSG
jgi:hypothetical protein